MKKGIKMRKLIWVGIISVVTMIVWIGFLSYDVNRFRKDIGTPSIPKEQIRDTKTKTVETRATDGPEDEQSGQENVQTFPPDRTSESIMQSVKNNANTKGRIGTRFTDQTSEVTGTSPVLQELFTEIAPFFRHIEEINKDLAPRVSRLMDNNRRQQEILLELDETTDDKKKIQLNSEFTSNTELGKNISPTVMKLQNEVKLLDNKIQRILNEYGFESDLDFYEKHWDSYEIWRSKQ